MPQRSKRAWRPQVSLKTFLLCCLLGGCLAGWVSQSFHTFLGEQKIIESLTKRMPPGSLFTVAINGNSTCLVGHRVM
jgi:hypothetical protein